MRRNEGGRGGRRRNKQIGGHKQSGEGEEE